jgi:hypothetical protein
MLVAPHKGISWNVCGLWVVPDLCGDPPQNALQSSSEAQSVHQVDLMELGKLLSNSICAFCEKCMVKTEYPHRSKQSVYHDSHQSTSPRTRFFS